MPSNYRDTVEGIAREVRDEYPNPDEHHDERIQRITEDIDGNEFIIYYSKNEEVLEVTSNEPDGEEVREMSPADADWRKMRTIAAFLAMERDVWEKLRELDEEMEERKSRKDWSPSSPGGTTER